MRKFAVLFIVLFCSLSIVQAQNLWDGLVASFPFNGKITDGSGGNSTAYAISLTADCKGKINSAVSFNGSNSSIDLGINRAINSILNDFTISYWINKSNTNNGCVVASYSSQNDSYWRFISGIRNNTAFLDFVVGGGEGSWQGVSGGTINPNNWYHIVFTRNKNLLALYVNGILQASNTVSSEAMNNPTIPAATTRFGYNFPSSDNEEFFAGELDEIRFYDRALSSKEIQRLYVYEEPKITTYDYWFDDNDQQKISTPVSSSTSDFRLETEIATKALPTGLHSIQIRFKDTENAWSSTTSQFFVKMPTEATGLPKIVKYEYWFDNDDAKKEDQSVTSTSDLSLATDVAAKLLPAGLHTFQIRFQDERGAWSSTTSQFFVKKPTEVAGLPKIVKYEYWFDNEDAKKEAQTVSSTSDLSLATNVAAKLLPAGLHTFQIRFQDERGAWSSTTSQFFVKAHIYPSGENKIVTYEYWFNDSINNRVTVNVDPINPLELKNKLLQVKNLNTTITKDNLRMIKDGNGNYHFATTNSFFIRFKDVRGAWSAVSDTTFASIVDDKDVNLSSFIVNPEANEGSKGWTTSGNISSFVQNMSHWTCNASPYFSLGDKNRTGWTASMSQTITGLPAGTYILKASGRTTTETTMTMSVNGVSVDFPAYGAIGGEIWEDAATGSAIKACNNGQGVGWSWRSTTFTTDGNPFVIQVSGSTTKANQWLDVDDFSLTIDNSCSLIVAFADSVTALKYKDMLVTLTNTNTGAKISLNTTGKKNYTFSGLEQNVSYRVSLTTPFKKEIGKIENIKLARGTNTVTFGTLDEIVPVSLKVLSPSGTDVTDKVLIQWLDSEGRYLTQGSKLLGMTQGSMLYYSVDLDKSLGNQYNACHKKQFTVSANNNIVYTLQPIPQITVKGIVKDENKWAIAGASVSAAQLLNGQFAKDVIAQTDKDGKYSLSVYNDSTTLIISSPGYINHTRILSNFNDSTDLGTTILRQIKGFTVVTNFTYTKSHLESETASKENYYSNYQNIAYSLFNITKNESIGSFNVQYPTLIVQDKTSLNDRIRVTASSRTDEFQPVEYVVTVNQANTDTAQFDLIEPGGIKATYSSSNNTSSVCILYDSKGQQVNKSNYYNSSLTFSGLANGSYKLVSMANTQYLNSVLNLTDLVAAGLVEGKDYVLNNVTVQSGIISSVSVSTIPALDESKFYYTGLSTSFTANKTSVVAGNFVTLRAKVDFKAQYANSISNLKVIVDLPENCAFIDKSVMVGSTQSAYTIEKNRITIPVNNLSDQVRFCITPTVGGTYAPTAFVEFDMNQKTVKQPIGSASFNATHMSIVVPNQTAKKTIPVSGTAPAFSTVYIYDGTTLIGQTTALVVGSWMTTCELAEAYNLTTHPISASIKTPSGITIQTETQKVEYNMSMIEVKTVTFINTAHGPGSLALKEYNTVFDFQHPKETMPPYWYWPNYPDFTFKVDFTNNDPNFVSDVTLYIKTSSNEVVPVTATYDKTNDLWVATRKFNSGSLPVNVSVGYKAIASAKIDGIELTDYRNKASKIGSDYAEELKEISGAFKDGSDQAIQTLFEHLDINFDKHTEDFDAETFKSDLGSLSREQLEQFGDSLYKELESTLHNDTLRIYLWKKALELQNESDFITEDGYKIQIQKTNGVTISTLKELGYEKEITTDGDTIYTKSNTLEFSFVSFKNNVFISISYPLSSNSILKSTRSTSNSSVSEKIDDFKKKFADINKLIEKIYENVLEKCEKPLDELLKLETDIDKNLAKIDVYLNMSSNPATIAKWRAIQIYYLNQKATTTIAIRAFGKILPLIQKVIPVTKYAALIQSASDELTALGSIYISIPDPCPEDQQNANIYKAQTEGLVIAIGSYIVLNIVADVTGSAEIVMGAAAAPETAGTSLLAVVTGVLQKTVVSLGLNWAFEFAKQESMKILRQNISNLYCFDCQDLGTCSCEMLGTCPKPPTGAGPTPSGSGDSKGVQDPSGYVYEAVTSNRLPGVTTTIYYKTEEEDMYGDSHEVISKWDASMYLQENPIITDENGIYAWDVPLGVWQVKYEKEGYKTKYSDWLPVPPPQLDINVGMVRAVAPVVSQAKGYTDGVEITFDKYMQPTSLTTSNITVTINGVPVSGVIKLVNEEVNPDNKKETFASRIRFQPITPFVVNNEIVLFVSKNVKSYAGVSMTNDYTQKIVIQAKAQSIQATNVLNVSYNSNQSIAVAVLPKEASAGKKIKAISSSPSIASVTSEFTLDSNGLALIPVFAELPGTAYIQISYTENSDLNAETVVNVSLPANTVTQTITLNAGWNIISANIKPSNTDLKGIFRNLIDAGKLKKVMDESGKTLENFGAFGGWKNSIGNWQPTEGYKVNVPAATVLTLEGQPIPLPFEIPLSTGWNIISYPATSFQNVKAAFQSLIDTGKLKKVMDESGKTLENFGAFGGWKNSIGSLTEGKGYKVNVIGSCTLTISEGGTKAATIVPEVLASTHFTPIYSGNGTDHMSINLVDLSVSGIVLGDELGVFDGSLCVGSAKVGVDQLTDDYLSIPVSASDGLAFVPNGFTEGHLLTVRYYREGKEYTPNIELLNDSKQLFAKGESIFIRMKSGQTTGIDPLTQSDGLRVKCYPNPFREQVTIEIQLPTPGDLKVEVFDTSGRLIRTLYKGDANKNEHLLWDGRGQNGVKMLSGTYLLKVNDLFVKVILSK
jgi:hypothetical protein